MKAIISPRRSRGRRGATGQHDALRGTKESPTRGAPSPLDAVLLQGDMERCYAVLRQLVPGLPRPGDTGDADTAVTNMDILQHVIDYILDLQDALDSSSTHTLDVSSSGHRPNTEQSTELLKGTEADEGGTLLR